MKLGRGKCRNVNKGKNRICNIPDVGVRFVRKGEFAGKARGSKRSSLGKASSRRGKMRAGECRRTRRGQKYCKRGGRVRFVRG